MQNVILSYKITPLQTSIYQFSSWISDISPTTHPLYVVTSHVYDAVISYFLRGICNNQLNFKLHMLISNTLLVMCDNPLCFDRYGDQPHLTVIYSNQPLFEVYMWWLATFWSKLVANGHFWWLYVVISHFFRLYAVITNLWGLYVMINHLLELMWGDQSPFGGYTCDQLCFES